jgi:hypothetical protein
MRGASLAGSGSDFTQHIDQRNAYRLVVWIGAASLIGGCAIAYWLTYKKYGQKE